MIQSQITINPSILDIYPQYKGVDIEFVEIIRQISLNDTICYLARINKILNNHDSKPIQQEKIFKLLSSKIINDSANKACIKLKNTFNDIVFFHKGQTYELFRAILLFGHNHDNDGESFKDENKRVYLFKALAFSSLLWSNRIFENLSNSPINKEKQLLYSSFRKSIEAQTTGISFYNYFGRCKELILDGLFETNKEYNKIFINHYSMTIEEFYYCLVNYITYDEETDSIKILNINSLGQINNGEVMKRFLNILSNTTDKFKELLCSKIYRCYRIINNVPFYNYNVIRCTPLVKFEDGRVIIFDRNLLYEFLDKGIIFQLLKYDRHALSKFGYSFENYINQLLIRTFSKPWTTNNNYISNSIVELDGHKVEVDGILEKEEYLIVFEHKAVFLREDFILSDKQIKIENHIRDKYGNLDGKIKGIGQLARSITYLAKDRKPSLKMIIPILVVYDELLTAPTFGQFFINEFINYLDYDYKSGNMYIINGIKIDNPIIITTSELEILEDSTRNFSFIEFIIDYSINCGNRNVSVNNFICYSYYHNKLCKNEYLISKGIELLDRTKKYFFD